MDLGLKGHCALVAAGSKGLGRACALALAGEGASVAIFARGRDALDETAAAGRACGAEILPMQADITQTDQLRGLVESTVNTFGRLDILVCNAGGPPLGTFASVNEEQWAQAFQLSLLSVVSLIQAALPHLRRHGCGRIINLVSTSAREPIPHLVLSNTIRPSIIGLAKSLAQEIGPDRITINNVLTGRVMTDRQLALQTHIAHERGISLEDAIALAEQDIPLRRFGTPDELSALVVFLASRQAAYITGTSIPVDGGLLKGAW